MQNPALKKALSTTSPKDPSTPKLKTILRYIWWILVLSPIKFGRLSLRLVPSALKNLRLVTTPRAKYASLTYRHEPHAFVLQDSKFFVSLLEEIRSHLLCSKETRAVYVSMAKKFHSLLSLEHQAVFAEPTDKTFFDYLYSNWPTFNSFEPRSSNEIKWGYVLKGNCEPNEVSIFSPIVESADTVAVASCDPHRPLISVDHYKLVLMVIILHELSHAYTKFHFNDLGTPLGVGPEDADQKRWLVEEELMGGRIAVEWTDKLKFGDMDSFDQVILTSGSESWVIDANVARDIVSSLTTPILHAPAKTKLIQHDEPVGSARARITEATKNPVPRGVPEAANIGLGFSNMPESGPFISYIGHDKF